MARARDPNDSRLLARVTARVLRDGAQALYRDPPLYDQLYRRRRHDVQFYVLQAQLHGGPVLELGAGSGRVTIAIARAGVDVVGVDVMPTMLAVAKARSAELPVATAKRARWRRGDLRSVRLGRRFPLVIAPFNTFMHLYTRRDMERALATCRAHLAARGRLIFDVLMPDLRALVQDPERLYFCPPLRDPREGTRYSMREASHYDPIEQLRSVTMVLEPQGAVKRAGSTAVPLIQRQWFPAEIETLLHYNGFELEARYGDFDGAELGPTSESQIIVARARPGTGRR